MGLESSKSNHIVDHIQKNMDNVVNTDTTAYESQLDFDKKTTCLTPQRGIDSSISEIVDVSDHNESPANPECSGDDSNQSRNDGQPQYSFPVGCFLLLHYRITCIESSLPYTTCLSIY